MTLQVHDELLFEVPPEEVETTKELVAEIMPQALKLSVPLKIDIKLGKNWAEMG
jgi:DNA polymerase-1